jgi:tetratricopeptide (TPR) repeat protein
MRRWLFGFIVLTSALPACASAGDLHPSTERPAAKATIDNESARRAIQQAAEHVQEKDLPGAAAVLDEVIGAPSFGRLSADVRYRVFWLAGAIALQRGQNDTAHRHLLKASEYADAESGVWHDRLRAAFDSKDYVDSARCIGVIARRWPKTLADVNDMAIFRVADAIDGQPEHANERHDLLESLFSARWKASDSEPEEFWRDLARLRLAGSDSRRAMEAVSRIHSPRPIATMRIDKRFDRLTQKDPRAFDVDRAIDYSIKDAQAQVDASPDKLKPVSVLLYHLHNAMQFERELAVADDIIAKTRNGEDTQRYKDFDENYVWVLDSRAGALAGLGRWEDALKQRVRAARRPERGGMNVSQVINLGGLYIVLGRPGDALEAVTELGSTSPYGRMQLEHVQLEAAVQRNDAEAVRTHLAYMREHRKDAIGTFQHALLGSGDMDGAASLLIERLGRDDWRSDALVEIQDYADTPATPFLVKRRSQWKALAARPDVQAALSKVGRIEHFKLTAPRS